MNLQTLQKEIHKNAIEHGWWEEEKSFGEIVALCHSELSGALEEARNGMPMNYMICDECEHAPKKGWNCTHLDDCVFAAERDKPEGIATEMADCVIRILDWAEREGINMEEVIYRKHEYNRTSPYKHGGKLFNDMD